MFLEDLAVFLIANQRLGFQVKSGDGTNADLSWGSDTNKKLYRMRNTSHSRRRNTTWVANGHDR